MTVGVVLSDIPTPHVLPDHYETEEQDRLMSEIYRTASELLSEPGLSPGPWEIAAAPTMAAEVVRVHDRIRERLSRVEDELGALEGSSSPPVISRRENLRSEAAWLRQVIDVPKPSGEKR